MSSNLHLESALEKDFANALEKFGIQNKYVQEFRTREVTWSLIHLICQPELKGWDFGTVEPSILEVQQKEADYFMKCIELEEQMAEDTVDPVVKKQMKDDVKLYRAEMEVLKWERINKHEEIQQQKQQQLLGISGVVLSITEEELLASVANPEENATQTSTAPNTETPDSLNQQTSDNSHSEEQQITSTTQTTDTPAAPENPLERDWTMIW